MKEKTVQAGSSVQGPGVGRKWQVDGWEPQTLSCMMHTSYTYFKASHVWYFSHSFLVSLILYIFIVLFPHLDSLLQLYELYFTDHKIHPFKVYSSVVLICLVLWNYHHYLILEHLHDPKTNLVHISSHSLPFNTPSPCKLHIYFLYLGLSTVDIYHI